MLWLLIFLFIGSMTQDFEGPDITARESSETNEPAMFSINLTKVETSTPTTIVPSTVTQVHPTLISAVPGLFINHFEPKIRTTTVLPISELVKKKTGSKLISQDVTRPPGWKSKPAKEVPERWKGVPKPKQAFKDSVGEELESNPNGDYLEETGDITEEQTSFATVPTTTEATTTSTTTITTRTTTVIPTTETVTATITVTREFQPGLVNEVEFLPGGDEPNQTHESSRTEQVDAQGRVETTNVREAENIESQPKKKGGLIDAEVNSISRNRKRPSTNNLEEFGRKFKKLGGRRIAYKKRTLVVHDVGVDDVRSLPPPPPGAFIIQLRKLVSIPTRRAKRETNTALVNSVPNKKFLKMLSSTVTPIIKQINILINHDDVIKQTETVSGTNEAKLDKLRYSGTKHINSDFRRILNDQPVGTALYTPASQNPAQIQVSPHNPNVAPTWQDPNGRHWTQQQNYWGSAAANQPPQLSRPVQTASLQQTNAEYWNRQKFQTASLARQGNEHLPWPAVAQQYRPAATTIQQPIIPPQPVLLLQSHPRIVVTLTRPIATVNHVPPGPQQLLTPFAPIPIGTTPQGGSGAPCEEGCKLERHNRRRINSEGASSNRMRIQDRSGEGAVDSATSPELLRKQSKEPKHQLHVKLPTYTAPLQELSEYPDTQYDDDLDQHPATIKPMEMERDRFRFETSRKPIEISAEKEVEMVPVGKSSITLDQLVNFAMDAVDSKIRSQKKESNPGDLAIEAANSGADYDYKTEETVNVPTSIIRTNRRSGTPYFKSAQNLMTSVYDQVNLVHYNPNSFEFEAGVPVLKDQPVQTTSVRPIPLYSTSRTNSLLKNVQLS